MYVELVSVLYSAPTHPNFVRGYVLLIDHLLPSTFEDENGITVSCKLSFKGLVLLNFTLYKKSKKHNQLQQV